MTRERDEHGRLEPLAHKRLANAAELELAGVSAISSDARFSFLDLKRKLVLSRKAIDHVVDGVIPPPCRFQEGRRLNLEHDVRRMDAGGVRRSRRPLGDGVR